MAPDSSPEQIQRLQAVVDALLRDLRRRTGALAPHIDMALTYDPARIQPDEVASE